MTIPNPNIFTDEWQAGTLPKIEVGEPINYPAMTAMGSCFSRNLNRWLNFKGYTDRHMPWDILYNPFSIQKEIERIFDPETAQLAEQHMLSELTSHGEKIYRDPWRTWITASTPKELREANAAFDETVKDFFKETDNILITLGLTEIWSPVENKDVVLNQVPIGSIRAGNTGWLNRLATMSEVYDSINATSDLIRHNITDTGPITFTLSPVPLKFTATSSSIREANTRSKATLAVALSEAVEARDDISYFPSYEIVHALAERPENTVWQLDNRHVGAHVVETVAREFLIKHGEPDGKTMPDNALFWVPRVDETGKIVGKLFTDGTTE